VVIKIPMLAWLTWGTRTLFDFGSALKAKS
jgi:hypothetical protein